MPKKFWQFRNQAAGSAELLLYGDISDSSWWGDEVTPKTFADELNALGPLTSLTVRINSGGGDVFAAQTIGNLLEQHTAQVTARIDGLCASAATIIACHCDKVVAANDSTYMIHPVRMGIFDFADAVTLQQYIGALNMISNNYIPEKINDANAYLDGTRMIGVAASVDLPEVNMKTGTVEGFGVGGEIDSPTIGQWESFEQEVQFNTLYSSAVDMLNPLTVVNLTFRAAQQVYDKTGGYDFKGLRVVEMGRVKKFKPGKIEKSEGMEATVTLELTYIMIEVDGEQLIEIDKLNGVYKVKGVDMLAKVRSLI